MDNASEECTGKAKEEGTGKASKDTSDEAKESTGTAKESTGKAKEDNTDKASKALPFALPLKKRCRLRACKRCLLKRHNTLVWDYHCQVANYLATSLDVIVMPCMATSGMIQRRLKKAMQKLTKQDLTGWVHCKFVNCLFVKCHDIEHNPQYKKKSLLLVWPKAYTSKTCRQCSKLHNNLRLSKTFTCLSCGYVANQDHNAAQNMIIKAIQQVLTVLYAQVLEFTLFTKTMIVANRFLTASQEG